MFKTCSSPNSAIIWTVRQIILLVQLSRNIERVKSGMSSEVHIISPQHKEKYNKLSLCSRKLKAKMSDSQTNALAQFQFKRDFF